MSSTMWPNAPDFFTSLPAATSQRRAQGPQGATQVRVRCVSNGASTRRLEHRDRHPIHPGNSPRDSVRGT